MKENKTLEFKQTITNTFLKTVSAFANYEGGRIIFGITDQGQIKGLEDIAGACLEIENKINDSISPQPDYALQAQDSDQTIILTVNSGPNKPYLYKSKAYKRNDTATIEVDTLEFTRLVLEGKNLSFEELPAKNQDLSFHILEEKFKEHTGIEAFNKDILKTLNLYSNTDGYNHAAAILADRNEFPGIDMAKFGENISIIHKRATFANMSALAAYTQAINLFQDYYQYEEITSSVRKKVELIPEAAFREAIANALIHRVWDLNAQIRVLMFNDRVEVISPGGLPSGITKENYLAGKISVLRNPILSNVFYRLNIVEIFGTGVLRIIQAYTKSVRKPIFEINSQMIKVILPILEDAPEMTEDEKAVYRLLSKTMPKPISEITSSVTFGKSKVSGILKAMAKRGIITIEGTGRGTKYRL